MTTKLPFPRDLDALIEALLDLETACEIDEVEGADGDAGLLFIEEGYAPRGVVFWAGEEGCGADAAFLSVEDIETDDVEHEEPVEGLTTYEQIARRMYALAVGKDDR